MEIIFIEHSAASSDQQQDGSYHVCERWLVNVSWINLRDARGVRPLAVYRRHGCLLQKLTKYIAA